MSKCSNSLQSISSFWPFNRECVIIIVLSVFSVKKGEVWNKIFKMTIKLHIIHIHTYTVNTTNNMTLSWKKEGCFCLFGFFCPTREFFTQWHMETSPLSVQGCKFWPLLILAIEQWGFFSMSHLLWDGVSVYNGHLRGQVTLTPILLSVKQWSCRYLFLCLRSVAAGIQTPHLPLARRTL